MATLDDLTKILKSRGGFEAVEARATETQLRLEGRVAPNATSHWTIVAATLLQASESGPWTLDYSKHYFLRKLQSGARMFYAHRLIFQAQDALGIIDSIIQVVHRSPQPSRVELQEFPLAGSGAHRDAVSGRGAFSVDRAPIGPQAISARGGR